MSIATTSHRRLLVLIVALSFGLAACGADETIDAGTAGIPNEEAGEDIATPEPDDDTADSVASDGFTALSARTDLISLRPATPDEVTVDPSDDSRLLIRFEGASEPCAGAAVSVIETETDVTVDLQTGLDPNVAAMSCVAQVFDYEIIVQLDAPLGEREINISS